MRACTVNGADRRQSADECSWLNESLCTADMNTDITYNAPGASRLVTFDGHIGSGALDVGRKVANLFRLQFFDQVALPNVDDLRDASDLPMFVERDANIYDRVWRWVERASSYFAVGAAGDDPLLQSAADIYLPLTWDLNGPRASANAAQLWTLDEVAARGDAVLVHRAGAVAIEDTPETTKVGLFAEWEDRVIRLMHREGIAKADDAERLLQQREDAQRRYYRDAHSADPEDPQIYDIIVNTSETRLEVATMIVSKHLEASVAPA